MFALVRSGRRLRTPLPSSRERYFFSGGRGAASQKRWTGRAGPGPLAHCGEPVFDPLSSSTAAPMRLRFSWTTPATSIRQTAVKGYPCTLLARSPPRPGRGDEGDTAMTSHRPAADPRHARPDHEADQRRKRRSAPPWRPLRPPRGNPLWCPALGERENALVTLQIPSPATSSQPSFLLLNLVGVSVVEESIGFGGPAPSAAAGRRPVGGRARGVEGRG